jgi:hypothetical protein
MSDLFEFAKTLNPRPFMTHFGDPCIHCGIPHDDVSRGSCHGDATKAKPIAYRLLGTRWDHVDHFLILMSTGEIVDRWEHCDMQLPYTYLKGVRQDVTLHR